MVYYGNSKSPASAASKGARRRSARLPDEGQDEFARLMLAELASEQRWADFFVRPESEDLLERLPGEASATHRAGQIQRLNTAEL